jgi:hypothetical protein
MRRRRDVPPGRAWADVPVSAEVLATGGPAIRREIREMARRAIEDVARHLDDDERVQMWRPLRFIVNPLERYGVIEAVPADVPFRYVVRAILPR